MMFTGRSRLFGNSALKNRKRTMHFSFVLFFLQVKRVLFEDEHVLVLSIKALELCALIDFLLVFLPSILSS